MHRLNSASRNELQLRPLVDISILRARIERASEKAFTFIRIVERSEIGFNCCIELIGSRYELRSSRGFVCFRAVSSPPCACAKLGLPLVCVFFACLSCSLHILAQCHWLYCCTHVQRRHADAQLLPLSVASRSRSSFCNEGLGPRASRRSDTNSTQNKQIQQFNANQTK